MNYQYINQKKKKAISGPSVVALHYEEGANQAPTVAASGRGRIAEKIIEMAKERHIPIQEDSMLVGNLIDMDLGESIPPQLYSVIAEILLLLEEMENKL